MVMNLNKRKFLKLLQEKTNYNIEKCELINNVLENNSLIGKKNKQKIINMLIQNCFTEDEAENIYDISINIIMTEIKNKIKHPFKSKD